MEEFTRADQAQSEGVETVRSPYGRNQSRRLHGADDPQPIVEQSVADRLNIPVHERPPVNLNPKTDLERMVEQLEAFNERAERQLAVLERIAAALERPLEVVATAGDETVRLEVRP
jgi:hypothetical protein